jgi:hypothetical protein
MAMRAEPRAVAQISCTVRNGLDTVVVMKNQRPFVDSMIACTAPKCQPSGKIIRFTIRKSRDFFRTKSRENKKISIQIFREEIF